MAAAAATRAGMGDSVDEALDEGGIEVGFGALGGLLVATVIGSVGLKKKNSWCLGIYLVLSFILTAFVIAGAVSVNGFVHSADDITESPIEEADDFDAIVTEALLAIYEVCCVQDFGAVPPSDCGREQNVGCVSDRERFDEILDLVPEGICGELAEEYFGGVPIVGNATEGGCGGGDPVIFTDSLGKHLSQLLEPLGYSAGSFALIILALEIFLGIVFFQKRKEVFTCCRKESDEDDDSKAVAGEVAATRLV